MVSSFSGKKEEKDALHQKFVLGLKKLQASGFRYFLYGTIYWERERKMNLGSSILSHLTSYEEHSDCLSCVNAAKQAPCFHPCCQNLVLQMAINCGLFCQRKDGHNELPDGSVLNTSSTTTKATPVSSSQAAGVSSISPKMQDVGVGTEKGNSGVQFIDASASDGTKGCNSPQGSQKANLSVPDQPLLKSSANIHGSQPKRQLTLDELKAECLQQVESIDVHCGELADFTMSLRVYLTDSKPSQDDATERSNLCYFLKIDKKHANKGIQGQVHISRTNCNQEHPRQVQGYSSFCGLCAMNNATGISSHGPPLFHVFDLDLAADIMGLKQICEISCGFCTPSEPMRCLDRGYSILAMENAAIRTNCTFQRLDVPLKALVDGAAIQSLDLGSLHEFYSLFWDCSGQIVLLMGGLRKSMQLSMQQIYSKFSLFYWHFYARKNPGGGYSSELIGVCRPIFQTLTLFQSQKMSFSTHVFRLGLCRLSHWPKIVSSSQKNKKVNKRLLTSTSNSFMLFIWNFLGNQGEMVCLNINCHETTRKSHP